MAITLFRVKTYRYYDWSSRSAGKTNLILTGADGEVCVVSFEQDESSVLPKATQVSPGRFAFYYHHSQLGHLIDMLRHEKPVFVHFSDDAYNNSCISTSEEPTTEGWEGQQLGSSPVILCPVDDRTADAGSYTGNFTGLLRADVGQLMAYASFNTDAKDAYRAIMEFELPQELKGKTVTRAELFFKRTFASGDPNVSGFKVYGYVGDGSVQVADANQIGNQIGGTLRMWDSVQRVDVTAFIRTFDIASKRYPGFVIRGHEGQGGINSSEAFTEADRPTLTIEYR
jgi:hypothetical protein